MVTDRQLFYGSWFLSCLIFCVISWLLYQQVCPVQSHCDVDSKAYLERGFLFYQTNKFVTSTNPGQPYYALGYPLIVGGVYKIFGQSVATVILMQLLFALLSCLLIASVTRRMFGLYASVVAAILFAFNVGYHVFTQFVLTELFLSFFLLLFFHWLVAFFETFARTNLIFAALALGTSLIIKLAALYFVFVVCMLLLVFVPECFLNRLKQVFIFAIFFYLPVIGYMTYNAYAFNNFALGTLDRVNIYYWFFPNVLATKNGTTSDSERTKLLALSGGQHNFDVVSPLFWKTFRQSPYLFIRVWFINVCKSWVGLFATNLKVLVEPGVHGGAISYFKMPGGMITKAWTYIATGASKQWVVIVGVLEALWSVLRYAISLFALLVIARRKQWLFFMLCITYLVYFSFITGHDGCARFRMMFEFVLIILTSGGIVHLIFYQQLFKLEL